MAGRPAAPGSGAAALLATAIALSAGACDRGPPPVLGVSSSARYLDAARLALSDATADGPLAVDTVFVAEDTNQSMPAVSAATRLVSIPGILAAIGHSNSAASIAASQIYDQNGVVQIAPHSSAVVYSRAGPWSFRLVPPDDEQAAFLAGHLEGILPDGGRVALLYVNDDYGRGLRADLVDALDPSRHPVVVDYPHTEEEGRRPGVIDATVESLADAHPDVVVWLARATVLHDYLPGIRERLGAVPVVGGDALATGPQHPNEDGRWNGVAYVDFLDVAATPGLRDFARRYEERFGVPAVGPDALTYDAVGLVLAAVADGARTPSELRDWLAALGHDRPAWEGLTGPVSFDDEGDVRRSYVIRTIGAPGG